MSSEMSHEEDEAREFLRWLGDEYDPASADELPRLTALLRIAFVRGYEAGRDAAAARLHEAARLANTRHLHDALNAHASAIRALVAPEGQ